MSTGESTTPPIELHLELEDAYRFTVDFGGDRPTLVTDEPVPLGQGSGPNPSMLLGTAVGNCLAASLAYCLRRAHVELTALDADVTVRLARSERGRLRIGGIDVELRPELASQDEARIERCLGLFEDFCVVTESVRHGIDVTVEVVPSGSSERR
jgi:organic hydroperoxide reductase OsmC/OhrA